MVGASAPTATDTCAGTVRPPRQSVSTGSSLVQYAYWPHTQLPHTAAAQHQATAHRPGARGELRPGDLLFRARRNGFIYHAGLYAGRRPGPPRTPHRPPGRGGSTRLRHGKSVSSTVFSSMTA
ncbi:NlpC/P60 family protein [Streptomyces subrutilus]|uniref:NlpC/P60 family protein n=1 Tax=Streptomyces subrutilus TaxID=36818 RepID=UPI0034066B51